MDGTRTEFKYCPKCGKKLYHVEPNNGKEPYDICNDAICRHVVKQNRIMQLSIEQYSLLQERYSLNKNKEQQKIFMLLKQDLSGPMLSKLIQDIAKRDRNTYNIITCESKNEAFKQFKERFSAIDMKENMIIPIDIVEYE